MLARIVSLLIVLMGLCNWSTPAGAVETSQPFVAPVIKDFRLDWCRNWGISCGGRAADLFCKEKGFDKATRWSIDPNVGARGIPTLVLGDGRLYQAPNCSGFRVIVCARVAAVLAATNEMQKQLASSGEGKLCSHESFHPVYKVTVVNAGNRDEPDVEINAHARPVYRGGSWKTSIRRGEQLTLVAVGAPILPGGPFSAPLLTSKQRFDEDLDNWYSDVLFRKDPKISVDVTGVLLCLGGDSTSQFCERKMKNLHTSTPQKVTEAYSFSL